MIIAHREPDKNLGKQSIQAVIDSVSTGVPVSLVELRKLGRTLKKRAADILAFFDRARPQQRTHRGDQRPPRTPLRLRPRLPQPYELHRQIAPRIRRIQPPTLWNAMSPYDPDRVRDHHEHDRRTGGVT